MKSNKRLSIIKMLSFFALVLILVTLLFFFFWRSLPQPQQTRQPGAGKTPSASPEEQATPPAVAGKMVYVSPGANLDSTAGSLRPGETLVLQDGLYANTELHTNGLHGTAAAPITIQAAHDGKTILDGGGTAHHVIEITNSSYITVEGLVAQNSGVGVVDVLGTSSHVVIRRVTAHDTAPGNNHVFYAADGASDVLFEDDAGWGRGRYIFSAYHATNITFRRCWAHWEHLEGFDGAPRADFNAYGASNITFENVIGEDAYPRPGISDNSSYNAVYETSDGPATDNVKYIGAIFYDNMDGIYLNGASGQDPQIINSYIETPGSMPGPAGSTTNEKGTGFTWWNHYSGSISNSTFTNTPIAANLPDGSATITNSVFYKNGMAIQHDHGHSYDDFYGNGSVGTTIASTDKQVDPGYDPAKYGRGAYLFIPPNSPLKHAGQGGADIGANIIYRSVDGVLTQQPLWPWPMEDRIKAETGYSVTWESDGGIWKTLDGVYPNGSSTPSLPSATVSPGAISWAGLSTAQWACLSVNTILSALRCRRLRRWSKLP